MATQTLTLLVALWSDRQGSERTVKTQAQGSLEQLARVASENVAGYLQFASQIVQVNRANMLSGLLSADDPAGQLLNFQALLASVPQLNGVLVGHGDGRFVFLRRDGPDSLGRFSRVIEVRPERRVLTSTYDARGILTGQSALADPYDPRERPWYRQARAAAGRVVWTDPYVFASSGQPGVTVASALSTPGGEVVIGADVQLRQLAQFLQGVQISPNGRAFVTDERGHAIATSRAWPGEASAGSIPLLRDVADPALRALLDRERPSSLQPGTHWYDVSGQQFAAVIRPVEVQPGVTWMIGVYAPTTDFTSGLGGNRRPLTFVLLVSLVGSLLAWPVVLRATRPLVELQRQATTDYLTGLPNRASFVAQLEESLRAPGAESLGLAVFDLDGFKAVNDTFGHHAGDEVLHAVGARMLAALRAGDTLGRLGGDEFALLVQATSREEVRLRVEGVLEAVARRPVVVDGVAHALASTAGLAFLDPDEGSLSSAQWLARADTALIRGKRRGKGRVWVEGEVTMPTLFR